HLYLPANKVTVMRVTWAGDPHHPIRRDTTMIVFVPSLFLYLCASVPLCSCAPRQTLRTPDQDSGQEHQHSAHHYLESSGKEGRVHIAVPYPAYGGQFGGHHHSCSRERHAKIGNEKR